MSGQFVVKSEGGVNAGTYMLLTWCNQPITNVLCDVLNTELTQGRNAAYARPLRCAALRRDTARHARRDIITPSSKQEHI